MRPDSRGGDDPLQDAEQEAHRRYVYGDSTPGQVVPYRRAGGPSRAAAASPAEAAAAVYLLRLPGSDCVSAQTLVCGGGFGA